MKVRLRTLLLMMWLLAMTATAATDRRFTLVIDAGHGGHDAGALGTFSKEKNINLNVALAFGRLVEANCPDVKVIYTRKNDIFVPLHERAHIANRNKADLFVSIHTNALPKGKKSRGLETYTLGMHRMDDNFDVAKRENSVILIEKDYQQHYEGFDPRSSESYIMFEFLQDKNMAQSVEMARLVQQKTCATAQRLNKGVKQAGFLVLRETSMPSCLIELGFITSPDEEQFLNTENGVTLMGRGIFQAFVEYKQKYAKGFNVPYKPIEQSLVSEERPKRTPAAEVKKPKKEEPVVEERSKVEENKATEETSTTKGDESAQDNAGAHEQTAEQTPVFKVQILASSKQLRPDNERLKGAVELSSYEENGMYKYTCGASTDYSVIYQLRKTLLSKFPEAFIVAFRQEKRMNVNEAIKEYRQNKNKNK